MNLEEKKKQIEEQVGQLNARRTEIFKQLEFTTQEFLRLEGEYRLIIAMLQEASTVEEKNNGEDRSENKE